MRKQRASRSIFLTAAKTLHESMLIDTNPRDYQMKSLFDNYSGYSCDHINFALDKNGRARNNSAEIEMYSTLFKPEDFYGLAWWPALKNGNWDWESRLLALLLCAEMLKR